MPADTRYDLAMLDRMGQNTSADVLILRAISALYVLLSSVTAYVVLVGWPQIGISADPIVALAPLVVALGAVGTALQYRWGAFITLPVSVVLLVIIPGGAVLGLFMARKLRSLSIKFR